MRREETSTKKMDIESSTAQSQVSDATCCGDAHLAELVLPSDEDTISLADFFKVLGDGTRLKILMLLEKEELCVHTITKLLGAEQSAISHQLKTLRNARIVCSRREGKHIFYRLCDNHIASILDTAFEHTHEFN